MDMDIINNLIFGKLFKNMVGIILSIRYLKIIFFRKKKLIKKEEYWIKYYNSTNPDYGYNIAYGGVDLKQLELAHRGWQKWKENNSQLFQLNIQKMQEGRVKQCSIPVKNIELDMIYYSAGEASRQTGTDQSGITKCCKGKQKTAGGYHWEYADIKRT